jgi:hypothetical protein
MKTKNSHELSAQQKEFVRNIVSDPALFATHILGVSLWDREAEILQSIKSSRRTTVKACHGVGKPSLWRLQPYGGWRGILRALFLRPRRPNARLGHSCGPKFIERSNAPECHIHP